MQNPPFNPFEFLTTPWGKLPLGGGLSGTSGFSPADLQELDKRISELKAVEQWLSFNHNLLKTTIQGLEVQRGTLAAIQSFTDSMSKPTPGGKAPDAAQTGPSTFSTSPSQGGDQSAVWWDSIQQQFGQMMQAAQASAASMAEPQAKTTKKPAAKKRADDSSQP